MILGIDEVGRGAWAGPLVVGAVILGGVKIDGLKDSKKLTAKKRCELDKIIRQKALAYNLGWVSSSEIDKIGLARSLDLACQRAVESIDIDYDEIIIDGNVNFLKATKLASKVTNIKKADDLVPAVSAASIIAKVARDDYMSQQAEIESRFGFNQNVGYGTKQHQLALFEYGATSLHRSSFRPIKDLPKINRKELSSHQLGCQAESVVADHLVYKGYKIITRNWRHQLCEIDIVAKKDSIFYFIEVKYRHNDFICDGLSSITPRKIKKMRLAARLYIESEAIDSYDSRLVVISATGNPIKISEIIEL